MHLMQSELRQVCRALRQLWTVRFAAEQVGGEEPAHLAAWGEKRMR